MFPIDVMKLRSATPVISVNIFDTTVSKISGGHPATAAYTLNSSGAGTGTGISGWTWLLAGLNSDLQVRATLISGTSPAGDGLGAWLSLNTTRAWSLNTVGGIDDCQILVEIRRIIDNVVIDSAYITFHVESNS